MYASELLSGSAELLSTLPENNQKFKNLLLLPEDEPQVYVYSGAGTEESKDGGGADFSCGQEAVEALCLTTQLKLMTSADARVASSVAFVVLDLRLSKKPSLSQIWRKPVHNRPTYLEVAVPTTADKNNAQQWEALILGETRDKHAVLLLSDGFQRKFKSCEVELALMQRVLALLQSQSFVSVAHGGAKELFRQQKKRKGR